MSIWFMVLGKGNEVRCRLMMVAQFIESYPLEALNERLLDHSFGHYNGAIIHWTGTEEVRADGPQ